MLPTSKTASRPCGLEIRSMYAMVLLGSLVSARTLGVSADGTPPSHQRKASNHTTEAHTAIPVLYVTNSSVVDCTEAVLGTAAGSEGSELWSLCAAALNHTRAHEQGSHGPASAQQEWKFDSSTHRWKSGDGQPLEQKPASLAANHGFAAEHARLKKKSERAVFGTDDRTLVDSTQFPYRAIGKIENEKNRCTAFLAFKNIIVTAAHCVLDEDFQLHPISDYTFYLGLSNNQPLAISGIDAIWPSTQFQTKAGCPFDCHFTDDDYALLRLEKPLGYVYGWLGVINFEPSVGVITCDYCDGGMEVAGYSADSACDYGETACSHKGCSLLYEVIYAVDDYKLNGITYKNMNVSFAQNDCDSQAGTSGSPLFSFATNHVYGINAYHHVIGSSPFPVYSSFNIDIANKAVPSGRFFEELLSKIVEEGKDAGDDYASAFYISTLPYVDTGNTLDFTNQHTTRAGRDVFYYFKPVDTVFAQVETCGSSFDTVLYIYSWSGTVLNSITSNDDSCGSQSRLSMTFFEGIEYVIIADGYYSSSYGEYILNITCTPSFSNADVCTYSPGPPPPPPVPTCANNCGGIDSTGCFCDELCTSFDDCCPDAQELCIDIPPSPPPPPVSCADFCGFMEPSGCYCNELCTYYNDCCRDAVETCLLTPPPPPASCVGYCNGIHPSGCFCDFQCIVYDDCCSDAIEQCIDVPPSPPPPPPSPPLVLSCEGYCGTGSPSGCFCDALCTFSDDCCPDVQTECGSILFTSPPPSESDPNPASPDKDAGEMARGGLSLIAAVLFLQALFL